MKTKQELVYEQTGAADPRVQVSIMVGQIWELMQTYADQQPEATYQQEKDDFIEMGRQTMAGIIEKEKPYVDKPDPALISENPIIKVKILKCSDPKFWYRNEIGKEFNVDGGPHKEGNGCTYYWDYRVIGKDGRFDGRLIRPQDIDRSKFAPNQISYDPFCIELERRWINVQLLKDEDGCYYAGYIQEFMNQIKSELLNPKP